MRYDVAIIGTGPAGLEAAITLKIRKKNIIVIGKKDSSNKVRSAERIDNYLGIPAVSGDNLAAKMLEHAQSMGVEITDVVSIEVADEDIMTRMGGRRYCKKCGATIDK